MAISFVQATPAATGINASQVAATWPSTPTNGNLLVAVIGLSNTSTVTPPFGWTSVASAVGNGAALRCFAKEADGEGSTTGNFSIASPATCALGALEVSGAQVSDVDVVWTNIWPSPVSTPITLGPVSTTEPNQVLVAALHSNASFGGSGNWGGQFVNRVHNSQSGHRSLSVATRVVTTTDDYAATWSGNTREYWAVLVGFAAGVPSVTGSAHASGEGRGSGATKLTARTHAHAHGVAIGAVNGEIIGFRAGSAQASGVSGATAVGHSGQFGRASASGTGTGNATAVVSRLSGATASGVSGVSMQVRATYFVALSARGESAVLVTSTVTERLPVFASGVGQAAARGVMRGAEFIVLGGVYERETVRGGLYA